MPIFKETFLLQIIDFEIIIEHDIPRKPIDGCLYIDSAIANSLSNSSPELITTVRRGLFKSFELELSRRFGSVFSSEYQRLA